jgi:sacsin
MVVATDKRTVGGTPFGRIPSLTAQIRELIHDYPEGIGIIKELAQNADDAGARLLDIVIDRRQHPGQRLPAPEMAALQGPALLFFNDSVFTEDDFDRIQEIYRSGKVRAADKTGQFGKGFNTVYNVTDWPSFVTGERVAFFDPHCSLVPGADRVNPGRSWTLAECWDQYPDLLAPFGAAGLKPGSTRFEGTIFRLPFRTAQQAPHSEISRKPFGEDSLRGLIDELREVRESLLLFLKRLEAMRLREVLASGEERERLVIETANVEEVRQKRQELLGILSGDALAVVQRLRGRCPLRVSYEHHFRTACRDLERDEVVAENSAWRVLHCLSLDPEGKIAEAVESMLGSDVKAVPLGGAAARLAPAPAEEGPPTLRGKVYCSLPLPIDTGLPVHLNGFFDLDSSRHALTTEAGLIGSAKVRARWNQLLVEHVVAPAYAHLIDHLAGDFGDDDPPRYYAHWPRPELSLPKPLDTLVKVAYQRLAPLDVIRVRTTDGWAPISKAILLPPRWDDLEEPLAADGLPLPEPRLSTEVVAGFQKAGITVQKVSPQSVRDRLRQVKRIGAPGVPVAQAPRDCLRQRPWLETLLRFCLSDRPKDLTDLPLALMANGQLRSFVAEPKYPIFAAGDEERSLFGGQPHWFLDQGYAEACGLTVAPVPTGVYWMTPGEVTRCLPALLPEQQEVRLHPDAPGAPFPTASWLTALYAYFLKAVRGGQRWSQDDFRKIPLVPDQGGVLRCPALLSTPLLARQQEAEGLSGALQALKVPLVTAPPELRDAIAAFAGAFLGFLWKLTGPDLVDTLANQDADAFPPFRPNVHPCLIGYLAQPQWTADMYRARPERLPALQQLRLFPTLDGTVVDLQGDVFIPGDFTPPACIRSVTLLQTGPANAWQWLLELGGVSRLTRAEFIVRYLLPEYEEMGPDDKLIVLRWLRDNLDRARSELEEEGADSGDLLQAVREAPLVRCAGGFHPAPAVYDPDSELIRDLFGDAVLSPDRTYYARGWERWSEFFRGLGLVQSPHAQDLLAHVDRLCGEAAGGLSARLTSRILKTFDHIEAHWTELCREAVEDEHGEDLGSALQERAWLPAEKSGRGLGRWPGAVAPDARLYRPDELYLAAQANLVASQAPVFARARIKAEVQRALGFQSSVPLETALLHFQHVLRLWDSAHRPRREPFEAALQDVYRYLAGYAKRPEAAVIRARFAGVQCIWYRGRLWLPEHAFRGKVPFFGHRRVTVQVKESAIRSAYQLLGVREQPSLADFLAYLEELVDAYGGNPLLDDETARLLDVYRRIGEEVRRDDPLQDRFPLLTQDRTLVDPQDAFYADAPWFEDRIKHPGVQFLHRGLPVTVTQLPWVRSLAGEVTERPTGAWAGVASPEIQQRVSKLEALIRSPEFRFGVARLVYHEHGVYRSSVAGWLLRASVVAVQELTSELVLTLNEEEVVVGSGPANQYLDTSRLCLFVDGNAGKLIRSFLAEAVNTGLSEHRLQNLSPLEVILDCEPGEIDGTLTRLRIRPVDDDNAFVRPIDDSEESGGYPDADEATVDGEYHDNQGVGTSEEEAALVEHTSPSEEIGSDAGQERAPPAAAPAARQAASHPSGREILETEAATGQRRIGAGADGERSPGESRTGAAATGRAPMPPAENAGDERRQPGQPAGPGAPSQEQARPRPGHSPDRTPGPERDPAAEPRTAGASPPGAQPSSTREARMRRKARRRRRQQRGQDRVVTYVSFSPQGEAANEESSLTEEERRERIALGDAAADFVCAFEREHGRRPTKLAQNHPGWDIDSFDARRVESQEVAGTPSRMIEVKGIRGPWSRQGVALSRRQFEAAQRFGARYWLYVVEFADDPGRARVHPIQNPFAKINQFWFDGGWRQLADPAEAPSAACTLTIGQRITVDNVGNGVVERVEQRGAIRVVHLLLDGGVRVRRPFNPATMRPASG